MRGKRIALLGKVQGRVDLGFCTEGQGSERSENGQVWTTQSSHSQVWSEVMNQTDCMVNGKRTD